MEIRKCNKSDIKDIYNLICELKNKELDYTKFEIAFISKIEDERNSRERAHKFYEKNGFKKGSYKFKIDL